MQVRLKSQQAFGKGKDSNIIITKSAVTNFPEIETLVKQERLNKQIKGPVKVYLSSYSPNRLVAQASHIKINEKGKKEYHSNFSIGHIEQLSQRIVANLVFDSHNKLHNRLFIKA